MKSSINKHQSGVTSLFVAVIVLFASTIIVLVAVKVGVQDQRISGNDSRAKQAFAGAEAGLEFAAGRLLTGRIDYTTTVDYISSVTYPNTPTPFYDTQVIDSDGSIIISSQGYADSYSSTSTATVSQNFGFFNVVGGGPAVPLMVAGNIPNTGNMEVVGNPNGAGTGVNVAIWTNNVVGTLGSSETCERGEYEVNGSTSDSANGDFNICNANSCSCDGTIDGTISSAGTMGSDIVFNDFPTDVFGYVFGVPESQYLTIKQMSKEINDCGVLGPNSNGIYWYEPDSTGTNCNMGEVGGATGTNCGKPTDEDLCVVILVVDDENLTFVGTDKAYGIFFLFDNPDKTDASPGQLNLGGGSSIYGALIGGHDVCTSNSCVSGGFDLVYERSVFEDLANDESNQLLARVAGSWLDQ